MKHKPLFLLLCSLIAITFYGCPQNDECHDPIKEWPMPGSASRWLFKPIKVGDTLHFKVYHKDKTNGGKYIYKKDESFIVKDTMVQKVFEENIYRASGVNCNEAMASDFLSADFTGSEPLVCQLGNRSITDLVIRFHQKNFDIGADQYLNTSTGWYDSLNIEGKKYKKINVFQGGNEGDNFYVDSTYCFYNLDYGMLKFIINDTLIYQRNLH